MRFRKSVKIAPGIKLNFSKSGVTTTVGKRGASINVGSERGPKATVGVPGSGLSHEIQLTKGKGRRRQVDAQAVPRGANVLGVLGWILGFLLVAGVLLALFAR